MSLLPSPDQLHWSTILFGHQNLYTKAPATAKASAIASVAFKDSYPWWDSVVHACTAASLLKITRTHSIMQANQAKRLLQFFGHPYHCPKAWAILVRPPVCIYYHSTLTASSGRTCYHISKVSIALVVASCSRSRHNENVRGWVWLLVIQYLSIFLKTVLLNSQESPCLESNFICKDLAFLIYWPLGSYLCWCMCLYFSPMTSSVYQWESYKHYFM